MLIYVPLKSIAIYCNVVVIQCLAHYREYQDLFKNQVLHGLHSLPGGGGGKKGIKMYLPANQAPYPTHLSKTINELSPVLHYTSRFCFE